LSPSTHTDPAAFPNGPIKAIYIDYLYNQTSPGQSVFSAVQGGFNLVILAFYLSSGPVDYASAWQKLPASEKATISEYAHNHDARIIVSFGGSTQGGFDTLDPYETAVEVSDFVLANSLDGVDFDLENFNSGFTYGTFSTAQLIAWIVNVTNTARALLGPEAVITHAPQAPYFGPVGGSSFAGPEGGYVAVYAQAQTIDYFNVQFYNQGPTCYTTYAGIFKNSSSDCPVFPGTSVDEISHYSYSGISVPLSKILVGKPVEPTDATNGYVQPALLGHYLAAAEFDAEVSWPDTGVAGYKWSNSSYDSAWIDQVYP